MKSLILKFSSAVSLLETKEKNRLIYVFIIFIISTFLDIVGIGLIVPILTIVLSGKISEDFSKYIPFDISNFTVNDLILIILAFFFIFYIFKSAFSTFALWYERRFIYNLQENISTKLLNKYMTEDYQFFLKRNYSDLVRNIAVEAGVFVSGVIHGFVAVTSEILVVFGISLLLIYVDSISSLIIISIILILVISYILIFKKKLRALGIERQNLEGSILSQLNKSFLMFKEMKIFSKHERILKNFKGTVKEKNKIALFEDLINGLPKIYFELLFVILLNVVLIFFIFSGKEISYIVPILGLYTAAFFRIFPSFNRLIGGVNSVIHNFAAFEVIQDDLNILKVQKILPKTISSFPNLYKLLIKEETPHIIELKNVSFSYNAGENKKDVLKDLSLTLKSGEITGLIGMSGSGKSTIANIISGFIEKDNGELRINGNLKYNKNLLNNLVGYLPQTTNLTNDTLLNNISFFDENEEQINHKKISEIISTLDMKELISSLPLGLNTKIQEQGQIFSGGQRQKIALARALYRETPILIFDESTSSLDFEAEKKLLELINIIKKDRIILFITHNKDLLPYFDNTYLIKDKKLQKQEK